MNEFKVTCVTKPDRYSQHEHITHIGSATPKWLLTREEAIRRIDSKSEAYYTVDPASGAKAYVGVVRETGKAPYLRTHADGKWNNNLLSLDECPLY
jgi:hypothetical protein